MQNQNIFRLYYKLSLWVVVIGYLCLAPADEFKKVHITIPYFDKFVHFVMFLILALLISANDNRKYSKNSQYLFFFLAALYGGLIELAQYYIASSRSADWVDWGADTLGVIIGVALFGLLPSRVQLLLT